MTNEELIRRIGIMFDSLANCLPLYESLDAEKEEQKNLEALAFAIEALKERKTGKWYGAENKCSCCNRAIWEYHTLPFDWQPRYCPNCGAKMEMGK